MNIKNLYENYHKARKDQKRIMSRNDFTYRNLLYFLTRYLSEKNNMKILDIGCGVGGIDIYLGSLGHIVTGIDISKNAISKARLNKQILGDSQNIKFLVVDFPNSIPEGKYDLIICSEVLEHLHDDTLAVRKIKSLLKKGGIVVASSPSLNAPLFKNGYLRKFDEDVGHLRRYSMKSFITLFTKSDLKIIESKKTEGIFRNFLFTNPIGGFLLKFLNKLPLSEFLTTIDEMTIPIFGESDLYIVAKKV